MEDAIYLRIEFSGFRLLYCIKNIEGSDIRLRVLLVLCCVSFSYPCLGVRSIQA